MKLQNDTPYSVEALPTTGPGEKPVVTIIVKGTFDLHDTGVVLHAKEQLPVNFGDDLYDPDNGSSVRYESDTAPYKARADIALVGHAYAPGGKPVRAMDVTLKVGSIQKTLRVTGDRFWKWRGHLLPVSASAPIPFTMMELLYERSFGGIDKIGGGYCKENLVGHGFFEKKRKKAIARAALPNIEDPQHLITSWKDHPMPAGFGFYGKAWSPRGEHLGTYDERWRKERAPRAPSDFSLDFYNAAHPDLQAQGYLHGDETVELHGLTPKGHLSFRLPGTRVMAQVTKSYKPLSAEETGTYEEPVALNLDTLCVRPDQKQFYLVWRGLCPVMDMTALEVKTVHVEDQSQRPVR